MFDVFGFDEPTPSNTTHSLFSLGSIDEMLVRLIIVAILLTVVITWGYMLYSTMTKQSLHRGSYLILSAVVFLILGLLPLVLSFISGGDGSVYRYYRGQQWSGEQSLFFAVIITPIAVLLVLIHFLSWRRSHRAPVLTVSSRPTHPVSRK